MVVHTAVVQQVEYLKDEAYCVSAGSDSKVSIIRHISLVVGSVMAALLLL
jgi:hypothetical protein